MLFDSFLSEFAMSIPKLLGFIRPRWYKSTETNFFFFAQIKNKKYVRGNF